jgi:hypothetical protein
MVLSCLTSQHSFFQLYMPLCRRCGLPIWIHLLSQPQMHIHVSIHRFCQFVLFSSKLSTDLSIVVEVLNEGLPRAAWYVEILIILCNCALTSYAQVYHWKRRSHQRHSRSSCTKAALHIRSYLCNHSWAPFFLSYFCSLLQHL